MNIGSYEQFFSSLPNTTNGKWKETFYKTLEELINHPTHGDYEKWLNAVNLIPNVPTTHFNFNNSTIEIGKEHELSGQQKIELNSNLQKLLPWRKGPFNLFGISIDTEWRSELKWNRLQAYLPDLNNKRILDVGCGNGYYMMRMLGKGARQVIGVDPNLLFLAQFFALTKNLQTSTDAHLLPLAFEHLPSELNYFDCVFSMGVLYHRRNPLEHINLLYQHTKPGGTVYIETLIVDESYSTELIPEDRYAGMRNVWSVPCPNLVQAWLHECGFINSSLLDSHTTTPKEQRTTLWMPYYSLTNYLDPQDPSKTIEGYPAPKRAIFSAQKSAQ